MSLEKVKQNIRDLLNLANNDAAAEGEIANAVKFADRLMAEHDLSEADLFMAEDILENITPEAMVHERVDTGCEKRVHWHDTLARFIGSLTRTHHYIDNCLHVVSSPAGIVKRKTNGTSECSKGVGFVGLPEDVAIAADLYIEMKATITAMAKLKWAGVYRGAGREYAEGFVDGLFDKLRASRYDEEKKAVTLNDSGNGTALVLSQKRNEIVLRKQDAAKEYGQSKLGLRRRASGTGYGEHHGNARKNGTEDGRKHDASVSRPKRIGHTG